MRLSLILCFVGMFYISAQAQEVLTFEKSIEIALQNNIDLQKQKIEINRAKSSLDEAKRLPNIKFSYSREDLKLDSKKADEWSTTGSLPLNFLWERGSKIGSEEKNVEAQEILLEGTRVNISSDIGEVFSEFSNLNYLHNSLNELLQGLKLITASAENRFMQGDISEYELKRILVQLNSLKAKINEVFIRKIRSENRLKLLIGLETDRDISPETLHLMNVQFDENQLVKRALNNRSELKAARLLIQSEGSKLTNEKLKAIPEINLSAGYKEQSDKFKGTVMEVSFDIPLFNRNQYKIEQSEIEISLLEKKMNFLKSKVVSEVKETYNEFKINKNLFDKVNSQDFKNVYSTSSFAYEQGEISLVEFMDGISAYIEGITLESRLKTDYMKSLFRLQKSVGVIIIESGKI